jgi:maltose O-acetyltransferase
MHSSPNRSTIRLVTERPTRGDALRRAATVAHDEVRQLHPRLRLAAAVGRILPIYVGSRIRSQALRLAGFDLGAGTLLFGTPVLTGVGPIQERLRIGEQCLVSWGCYLDLAGSITVGDRVGFSPQVRVVTSSHELGTEHNRVGEEQPAPVVIEDGVWLGVACTILPGVTVHRGAVVAAGAVVTRDVPANAVVGGVPARVLQVLDEAGPAAGPSATMANGR